MDTKYDENSAETEKKNHVVEEVPETLCCGSQRLYVKNAS